MTLDAKSFYNKFTAGVTVNGCYMKYSLLKGFTNLVKRTVSDIVEEYELEYYPEYYTIDYTAWYTERDAEVLCELSENFGFKKSKYCWNMMAAIEHENENWDYEVLKLSCINCPLRVVIGYNDKTTDCEKLDYIAKRLSALDSFIFDADKGQEFMIILGNDEKKNAEYRGYLYSAVTQKFEKAF